MKFKCSTKLSKYVHVRLKMVVRQNLILLIQSEGLQRLLLQYCLGKVKKKSYKSCRTLVPTNTINSPLKAKSCHNHQHRFTNPQSWIYNTKAKMECHTGQIDKYSIWAKPKIWRPSIEFQRIKTNIDNCTSNYSLYVILIQNNTGYNNSTVMGRATIPTPPPSFNRSSNSPTKATWHNHNNKNQNELCVWQWH